MKLEDLEIPIREFKGIGPKTVLKLEKNKIKTIRDLIFYFPYKYQDLTQVKKIKDLKIDETAVIIGKLSNLKLFPTPKRRMFILQGIVSDETGSLKVSWYNQPFLVKTLKNNSLVALVGKLTKNRYGLHLQSPKFQLLSSVNDFQKRIVPVYSEIEGIRSSYFEKLIQGIIKKFKIENLVDSLPWEILQKFNYPSLGEAILTLHQPSTFTALELAKERLSFEELLVIELALLLERKSIKKSKAPIFKNDQELTKKFLNQFGFKLTVGQQKVLDEIFNDLRKGSPMNRLLQGETGAGKTLIAEIISLNIVKDNFQVVFMAPTEILAQQHFQKMLEHFKNFDYGLGLITSGQIFYGQNGFRATKTINEINRFLKTGQIKILIGTHSLIENSLSFQKVGLMIIDEQQRFGTEQRKKLLSNTQQEFSPHFLSMTATPIPRTLALAFYGDLDFSYLEDKPFGQKKVKTYVVLQGKEEIMWNFVRKELNEGHQIFVICPRVEEKEDEIASVKKEYERIKKVFVNAKIAMLHGKMKPEEKEKILKQMQKNEINLLVSSSVVEVGIDLPLATVIIILSPERFGLAQLYQLKGRVGRSVHQGYCFLVPQKLSSTAKLRLKYFLQAKSALELSEYDLKLRGGGELLGQRQAGIPDLAMQSLSNFKLVNQAKKIAESIIDNLEKYPNLKRRVNKVKGLIMA
jgi:ATP-dependent DNA helicase RecG